MNWIISLLLLLQIQKRSTVYTSYFATYIRIICGVSKSTLYLYSVFVYETKTISINFFYFGGAESECEKNSFDLFRDYNKPNKKEKQFQNQVRLRPTFQVKIGNTIHDRSAIHDDLRSAIGDRQPHIFIILIFQFVLELWGRFELLN